MGAAGALKRIERGLGTHERRQTMGPLGPAFISETRFADLGGAELPHGL